VTQLTQPSLVDLFRRQSEHTEQFDHDFNYHLCHCGSRLDLSINLESTQKGFHAFKDIEKGIVTCLNVLGRLAVADIITREVERASGRW
jgi:hypothetical protein